MPGERHSSWTVNHYINHHWTIFLLFPSFHQSFLEKIGTEIFPVEPVRILGIH